MLRTWLKGLLIVGMFLLGIVAVAWVMPFSAGYSRAAPADWRSPS